MQIDARCKHTKRFKRTPILTGQRNAIFSGNLPFSVSFSSNRQINDDENENQNCLLNLLQLFCPGVSGVCWGGGGGSGGGGVELC